MDNSIFSTAVLPVALAVIMASLGMALTLADFRRVMEEPRAVGIGLLNLLLLSPLLAFAIAEAFNLNPAFAVGLVLLGASPGGTLANLMTHFARGETALSITMTAISSVAAVVTVPLFLKLATHHFGTGSLDMSVDMVGIVARVLVITVVPLGVGMWLRARRPELVARIGPGLRRATAVLFAAAVIGVIIAESDRVTDNIQALALATLTLNVAAMSMSFMIARFARLDSRKATAIAMELGIHNSTLAIAVGASIATVLTVPAAIYASIMFIPAGLFAWLMYRLNGAPEPELAAVDPASPQ
jgi:bile acid:Na+ symporter, BASS family